MKTKPNPLTKQQAIILHMELVKPDLVELSDEDLSLLKKLVKDYRKNLKQQSFGHVCTPLGPKLRCALEAKLGAMGVFEQLRAEALAKFDSETSSVYCQNSGLNGSESSYKKLMYLVMRNYRYNFLKCWAIRLERHLEKQNAKA